MIELAYESKSWRRENVSGRVDRRRLASEGRGRRAHRTAVMCRSLGTTQTTVYGLDVRPHYWSGFQILLGTYIDQLLNAVVTASWLLIVDNINK